MKDLFSDLAYVFGFGVVMTVIAAIASGALYPEPVDYTTKPAFDVRKLAVQDSDRFLGIRSVPAVGTLGKLPASISTGVGR